MLDKFHFALDSGIDTIKTEILHSVGSTFSLYDKGNHRYFTFNHSVSQSDIAISGVDFSRVGSTIGLVSIHTPYGDAAEAVEFVVYDPTMPQVERLSLMDTPYRDASFKNYEYAYVPLNATEFPYNIAVEVYCDTGYYIEDFAEPSRGYQLEGFDASTVGVHYLLLTYEGHRVYAPYYVYDPANILPMELRISCPNALCFGLGDPWREDNIIVYYRTDDGNEVQLSLDEYVVSGYDSSMAGQRTLTVAYRGMTAVHSYVITDYSGATVESISVCVPNSAPIGGTVTDLGLSVQVQYTSSNQYPSRLVYDGFTVSGFDSTTSSSKRMTVSYRGVSTTVYYTVK